MNARVLELIKNPENFQPEDLQLLDSEISKYPYIQSFRALYLYGTHRFDGQNYQNELSKTAAYTTDKKILYQFINKEELVKPENELPIETETPIRQIEDEVEEIETVIDEKTAAFLRIEPAKIEVPKPVMINGEVNRILFEGEEDFLDKPVETIDLESTKESGTIVTHRTQNQNIVEVNPSSLGQIEAISKENLSAADKGIIEQPENINHSDVITEKIQDEPAETEVINNVESEQSFEAQSPEPSFETETENFTPETVINEDEIPEEKPEIEKSAELSFHGVEDFLPKVEIPKQQTEHFEKPKQQTNRHEDEMKRLIAEVEAKMKLSKKEKPQVEKEIPHNSEINFAETHDEINKKPIIAETPKSEESVAAQSQKSEEISAVKPVQKSSWKPMQPVLNTPDSLINKEKPETPSQIIDIEKSAEKEPEVSQVTEQPAINISFFTPKVEPIQPASKEVETQIQQNEKASVQDSAGESNVPSFINTWQNWLKIDRKAETQQEPAVSNTEIKNKVIENFIENEPKISKLKEESDFVVKERTDDISHLMTETLAKLYTEQKLYSKAIKAYEILSAKYPDKKEYFKEKIQEIKEQRKNQQ